VDETCPISTEGWTRHVQLVRRDGRDVSTLYGREGGGHAQTHALNKTGQRRGARAAQGAALAERRRRGRGAACPISTG